MRHLSKLLAGPLERSYQGVTRAFDSAGLRQLMPGAPPLDSLLLPHWEPTRGMTPLRRMLYLDSRVWLPDDLLVKADKMTMAWAVELRVPFLDHHLVEHAWSLPDRFKVERGVGKYLLRKAARGRVPDFVLARKKEGFTTPTAAWLRTGLHDLLRDSLLHSRSFTATASIAACPLAVERHRQGADLANELWPLLVLELWHQQLSHREHVQFLQGAVSCRILKAATSSASPTTGPAIRSPRSTSCAGWPEEPRLVGELARQPLAARHHPRHAAASSISSPGSPAGSLEVGALTSSCSRRWRSRATARR